MKRYRVGAMAWALSALVIPIQLFVALGWPNRYSLSRNTISDLGVTTCGEYSELGQQIRQVCSPEHAVFNIGMVASGALVLLGAVVLHGYWARLAGQAGTILMAIAGASVIGVGLFPWDVSPAAHDGFALLSRRAVDRHGAHRRRRRAGQFPEGHGRGRDPLRRKLHHVRRSTGWVRYALDRARRCRAALLRLADALDRADRRCAREGSQAVRSGAGAGLSATAMRQHCCLDAWALH